MNEPVVDYYIWPHYFFFQVLPYIVAAVFFLGCFVRLLISPYTWKSQSSEFLNKRGLLWGSNLFHIGILLLLAGHLFGLFLPAPWLDLIGFTPPVHQMIEVIAGGIAATICVLGLLILIFRRLFSKRVRVNSRWSDWWVLLILGLALGFGVNTLIWGAINDSSGVTLVAAGDYVRDLFSFWSDAWRYTLDLPIWMKLHMEFGLLVFLCVPFTRLVHAWSGIFTPFYLFRPMQLMRLGVWLEK
ncbi:MAG: respiratory nitrate reductase subunit gamma [Burkholderiales bacterium]|nr:respiratory nitrate reductase subunit gamma [Burkholderiales bacterium]